jgi:uncharacterized damage-inducible protein DinB
MTDLNETVASSLATRYKQLAGMIDELATPLSDDQFWAKPFAFGNSFGHLMLHLTGNLNYYIGAQIAGTGYVRNRPLEFSEASRPPKAEVMKAFDDAMAITVQTILSQSAEDWSAPYSAAGSAGKTRFEELLQCATHLHHHIGQMIYLGFELKRKG